MRVSTRGRYALRLMLDLARISILSELHGYYLVMVKGSKIGLEQHGDRLLVASDESNFIFSSEGKA